MNKQKKHNTLRLIIQCISFAFHNGYVNGWIKGKIYTGANKQFCVPGLNCYSCPGAIGSCPIGSLQAVLDDGGFHISLYVIGFIGAVGVFCGRFVCGWLCPFGLVQDLLYRIPFFKKIKNLPGHKYLRYLRFVILAVFVIALPMGIRNQAGVGQPWFCEFICPSGTLLGGIPLTIANPELAALIGPRFIWKVVLLVLIIAAALLSDRPFCKYICPLGALYGLANPISIYRYRVDKDACISCGACQKACGGDIKVWETPNSMDCIRCGKCIAACPTGALTTTFSCHKNTNVIEDVTAEVVANADVNAAANTGANATAGVAANADVNAAAEIAKDAEANGSVASETASAPHTLSLIKKILILLAGLVCVGIAVYELYQMIMFVVLIVGAQSFGDIVTYLRMLTGIFIMMIPAVMMLLLGAGLIVSAVQMFASKPAALYERLRRWPSRILKTIGIGLIVTFLVMIVIVILLGAQGILQIVVSAISFMISSFIPAIMMAAAAFITWLIIKPDKMKK